MVSFFSFVTLVQAAIMIIILSSLVSWTISPSSPQMNLLSDTDVSF